jgi:hypothetical protein
MFELDLRHANQVFKSESSKKKKIRHDDDSSFLSFSIQQLPHIRGYLRVIGRSRLTARKDSSSCKSFLCFEFLFFFPFFLFALLLFDSFRCGSKQQHRVTVSRKTCFFCLVLLLNFFFLNSLFFDSDNDMTGSFSLLFCLLGIAFAQTVQFPCNKQACSLIGEACDCASQPCCDASLNCTAGSNQ